MRISPLQPRIIPVKAGQVPTGPNLVKNPSFELGSFSGGTDMIVDGLGVIQSWQVVRSAPNRKVRWIDTSHPMFSNAAEGRRLVDLTGGVPPAPGRVLGNLYQDAPLGLKPGGSYEVAIHLGVGPDNGPLANFGKPIVVEVALIRSQVRQLFVCNPVNQPAGSGVVWERFSFRFAIPSGFNLPPGNQVIDIIGMNGNYFLGVDNVSVHELTP